MFFIRCFATGLLMLVSICGFAYTVGGTSRPTFGTAPQGNIRPSTQSSGASRPATESTGSVRPTTQPGNSSGFFTEPTGPVRPSTPQGLSSQHFTPPTGPVRPGLDSAASGMQEAFSLAPQPSGKTASATPEGATVKQAAGVSGDGIKAAKLGGGESGMGGMTAAQQEEREKAAKNSEAAAALSKARDQKAVEQTSMSQIKGIVDALGNKDSKVDQKVREARK